MVADEIPSEFFLIEVEVDKVLVVPPFDGLEILLGLHFFFFGEGEDIGDLSLIIVESAIEFTAGILVFELISMPEDLYVDNGGDIDFFEFEVESHILK